MATRGFIAERVPLQIGGCQQLAGHHLLAYAGRVLLNFRQQQIGRLHVAMHEAGAKFYCCSPNLDLFDMTTDDLIPECEGIVGGAHLIEEVMEEDCKVLTY